MIQLDAWLEKDEVYEAYVGFSKRELLITTRSNFFSMELKRVTRPWSPSFIS